MKNWFLLIVLFLTTSCMADSFLRRITRNDIAVGKYDPDFLSYNLIRITFPQEDYRQAKQKSPEFDETTKKKLKALFDFLDKELDKDPIVKKTKADIETIQEKVDNQWEKIQEIAEKKISIDYSQVVKTRQAEIVKSSAYQELLNRFTKLYKECLPKKEKIDREIIEELKKRNIEPDELFPGMPTVEYYKIPRDIIDKFADQLKEVGMIFLENGVIGYPELPTLTQECTQQLQDLSKKILEMLNNDPQIVAAQHEIKLPDMTLGYADLYSYALQKELGIEKLIQILDPISENKIKELGIREKLQEIRKTLSKDILKKQQEYDMAVDRVLDKAEQEIQNILNERRAQKAIPGVAT